MKITIESYGEAHSTEMSDDATVDQAIRAFFNLMICCSYLKENLLEVLKDGDPNNWDSAWPQT